jgi:hypothetical protein
MITVRHNRVAAVVKEAIIKFASKDLRSDIVENAQVQQEGLAEHLQILRPKAVLSDTLDIRAEQEYRLR